MSASEPYPNQSFVHRIDSIYFDDSYDPGTDTFKNPQAETNTVIGTMYRYQDRLHRRRVWADLRRPEAKPYFAEPTYG